MMHGTTICERYKIETELGAGGFGSVYKGIDLQTQQIVAIKKLKPNATDRTNLERFRQEGEALRTLNHPNIVKMLDMVEENNIHYLIMEYVDGGDLAAKLRTGRLSYHEVLPLALDLADALTRAHKLNIIHRDLKPANILLDKAGTVYLTDFGVARIEKSKRITETGTLVGSVGYVAPESLAGEPTDARSDIWSFGVILFEMLSGRRLFNKGSVMKTMLSVMHDPIPELENLAPDVPIALVDLVHRMLERAPQSRVPSVRHVGAELEDILQGRESEETTPLSPFEEITQPILELERRHNLPTQSTIFVGREDELVELEYLLDDPMHSLITIIAPGGMGKTRLALALAERNLDKFADGVYFIDLSPLTEPESIVTAIADAVGLVITQDQRSSKQQVLDYLGNKRLLLVMDNWEHIVKGASLAAEIIHMASDIQIVTTSRVRLGQFEETLFHLDGMDFPDGETVSETKKFTAGQLFINSAKRVLPTFELTDENLPFVVQICQLVGGMPLGIILAASWLSTLAPEEIAQEIAHGIDFLEASGHDIIERQQSIQYVFDYSWQMLSPTEQKVYMEMSILKGSFTRDAAQVITGANLRELRNLVNKSLLRRDAGTGRYSIHELARQFAFAQLEETGELERVRRAQRDYYATLLDKRQTDLWSSREEALFRDIDLDFENLRLAWQFAIDSQAWSLLAGMIDPVRCFLTVRGRYSDGKTLFSPVISNLRDWGEFDEDQRQVLIKIVAGSVFLYRLGLLSVEDLDHFENKCLALAREKNDTRAIIISLLELAYLFGGGEPEKAQAVLDEALQLARAYNDKPLLTYALILNSLGETQNTGDIQKAIELSQESLQLAEQTGDLRQQINNLCNLAIYGYIAGDLKLSFKSIDAAQRILQGLGNVGYLLRILDTEYELFMWEMRLDEAKGVQAEMERIEEDLNLPWKVTVSNYRQFNWLFIEEAYEEGIALWDETLELEKELGITYTPRSTDTPWNVFFGGMLGGFAEYLTTFQPIIEQLSKQRHFSDLIPFSMPILRILEEQKDNERCVECLSMMVNHPLAFPIFKKHPYIKRLQTRLKRRIGVDHYHATWKNGKSKDVAEVMQKLFAEYIAMYPND